MQYLQKFIQKDLGFGYALGEPVTSHDRADVWTLHRGTSKDSGDPALVFVFDPSKARPVSGFGGPTKQELVKAGLMRLKTLRHPDVLRYLSSVEGTDGTTYIATEPATPLSTLLARGPPLEQEAVQWGIFTIARALGFMHQAGLIHGRLNASSIFVTPSGDWKLGGLEAVTQHASAAGLSRFVSLQAEPYRSPEFAGGNWSAVAAANPGAVDSWALGCLMYEAHAGSLTSPDQLRNVQALPKPLLSAYQKLLGSNPAMRAPAGEVPNHPYFKKSKFIELNMFVENLELKGQLEREAFLGRLPSIMDRLPDGFCTFKVLPMLSQSIENGAGGSSAFACVVKMRSRLSEEDFTKNVVQKYAVRWYGSQTMERSLRVELYAHLDMFINKFQAADVNGAVFAAICAAFQDMQAPALRDAAVKSVLSLAPVLTDKNLNSVLMSHFARLQVDPEPAIRTNTTVCLGKLAVRLSPAARNKVLIAAFLRALKDPFPPARAAGVNAILTTSDLYSVKDVATRVLPAVAPLTVDQTTDVRNIAFKVVSGFLTRLTTNHEGMTRAAAADNANGQANGDSGALTGATGGSSASGWGLSSFSSMTAALLNKSDASGNNASKSSSGYSTGISSDDFKKGSPSVKAGGGVGGVGVIAAANGISSDSWGAMRANTQSKATGVGRDTWDSVGSGAPAQSVAATAASPAVPAAFSTAPLTPSTASVGGFGSSDAFGGDGGGGDDTFGDDDDQDGWGDMDIKATNGGASGAVDEEDLFLSMMGPMGGKSGGNKPVPTGMTRSASSASSASGSNQAVGGDLWDLAPPRVSKPKPRTNPGPTGMGLNVGTATSRRTAKKSTGDDWSALLGGAGSGPKRKPVSRQGLQR